MLTRWSDFDTTFSTLDLLRRRMDRLFDEYRETQDDTSYWRSPNWPRINISDAGSRLSVTAEVPGLSEKDVQVNLNQDVLSISGQRKVEPPAGYSVHRQERGAFQFSRSFSLPCKVDPEGVSATVIDGLLTITMEKAKEAQSRQITVKAS